MDGITDSADMSLSKLQEVVEDRMPGALQSKGRKESETTQQLNNKCKISEDHFIHSTKTY